MSELLKTPLHSRQQDLKSKNVSFCGWDMPIQFDSIIAEHTYCRENVALFDTSHMGELFFTGDISLSGINEATSIDIASLPIGKCKYGFLLNEQGGVHDDLIIYKFSDTELMLVVNAATTQNDFDIIKSRLNSGELVNKSSQYAKLDIQGPNAIKVLQKHFDVALDEMKFFSFTHTKVFGEDCILSRTGYTGELGFELYIDNNTSVKIWDSLVADGVKPAGLGARDLLRLEMGYSLYGNELAEDITPLEASLGMFINLKRDYVGKDALQAQKDNGLKRTLIPFKTLSRRSARKDFLVFQGDKEIGFVTSAVYSPILSVGIGFAMVNTEDFNSDEEFELRDARGAIKATQTKLPFITKLN